MVVEKVKRQIWWWWARGWVLDKQGRQRELIIGAFTTEAECRDKAYTTFIGEADVRVLPTMNESRASHFFRYGKFQEGATPAEALGRFRHRGEDLNIP